jgi:hypothetical protein
MRPVEGKGDYEEGNGGMTYRVSYLAAPQRYPGASLPSNRGGEFPAPGGIAPRSRPPVGSPDPFRARPRLPGDRTFPIIQGAHPCIP